MRSPLVPILSLAAGAVLIIGAGLIDLRSTLAGLVIGLVILAPITFLLLRRP